MPELAPLPLPGASSPGMPEAGALAPVGAVLRPAEPAAPLQVDVPGKLPTDRELLKRLDALSPALRDKAIAEFAKEQGAEPVAAGVEAEKPLAPLPVPGAASPSYTRETLAAPASESGIFVDPMTGTVSSADPQLNEALQSGNAALATGIRRGMTKVPLGIAETVGEQVAPGTTKELTDRYNAFEAQFDEVANKQPGLALTGELIGTTLGVLLGAGAIGAVTPAAVAAAIPAMLKGAVATGVIAGGTAYLPTPGGRVVGGEKGAQLNLFGVEVPERLAGGVFGGAVGGLARSVLGAVSWGVKNLTDSHAFSAFTTLLTDVTKDVSANSERALKPFLSHVERTWARNRDAYTIRDTAGREIAGFDTAAMAEAVERGVERSTVSQRGAVRAALARVDEALGIKAAEKAQAQYAAELKAYEAAVDNVVVGGVKGGARSLPPQAQQALGLPARPAAPELAVVSGEQFSKAIDALHEVRYKGSATNAIRTQLSYVENELWKEAGRFAKTVDPGMNAQRFIAKSKEAGAFYRENIQPIKDTFGESSLSRLTQGASELTPMQMYEAVVKVLEGGKHGPDKVAFQKFMKAVGPEMVEPVQRIAAKQMFDAGVRADGSFDAAKLREWFQGHREVLADLLPRDVLKQVDGMSKVMGRVAVFGERAAKAGGAGQAAVRAGSGFFGTWQLVEAVYNSFAGGPVGPHLVKGALWVAGYPTAAAMYKFVGNRLHDPRIKRLMERAATMQPDSAEMDALMGTMARVSRQVTAVGARLGAPGQGEVQPQVRGGGQMPPPALPGPAGGVPLR